MIKVKNDHPSKFSNLSNWKEAWKKNQGFKGSRTRDLRVTGALLYQLSYETTLWERGQFIEFPLKPWFFSGFFLPIALIGKFTAMIILHCHLQPQFKKELFHIYFTSM